MGQVEAKTWTLKDGAIIQIRTVQESDAEAYLSLGKSIMAEEIYSLTQPDELNFTIEQEKDWILSHLKDEDHLVLCATLNGEFIGQLDFSNGHRRRNAHTGEFGMGVHKNYRSQGIGSLLIQTLIEWARKNPRIEKINLCVHKTNERAINAYKKHGFLIEGIRTRDLKYPGGIYVDTVLMGLSL